MLLSENFKVALRALRANKLRSILTILGIVIGVATVVALLAIGNGATASITNQIKSSGSNLLTISPGRQQGFPGAGESRQASHLYYADYELLTKGITDNISAIVPSYQSAYTIKYGDQSLTDSVSGTIAAQKDVRSLQVTSGRFLSDEDNKADALVAVLGSQVASDLFASTPPVGKTISINGMKFMVVGVLASKGAAFGSPDDTVFIPLQTGYDKLFGDTATFDGKRTINNIVISVKTTDAMNTVSAEASYLLRHSHKLKPSDTADFNIQNQTDILNTLNSVTQTLTTFLGAIAGISLLVGGIGIMNIMLVSVTERTREIGLRKAVGATKNQILTQFLIETVTLSLMGGIIGILLGVSIATFFSAAGLISSVITPSSIFMAFSFALAIGIFFGLYPAFRASNLHPMEALRYE
jgi:putative ABC transport system permease protein